MKTLTAKATEQGKELQLLSKLIVAKAKRTRKQKIVIAANYAEALNRKCSTVRQRKHGKGEKPQIVAGEI